jgi:hypothetical protein
MPTPIDRCGAAASQGLTTLPVTTSDWRLLALLEREAAERALRELNPDAARTLLKGSRP